MEAKVITIPSDGILSFSTSQQSPERYLDIAGETGYLINYGCGTCGAVFQRMGEAQVPLSARDLSHLLEQGLEDISLDIIDTLIPLFPKGKYILGLVELTPTLFSLEQALEHPQISCSASYFWYRYISQTELHSRSEIVLPLTPESGIKPERVAYYIQKIQEGAKPTVLALSMIDFFEFHNYPWVNGVQVRQTTSEWILAHFLIDGHHKMMAASQLGLPITILSALSIDQSLETLPHSPERDSFIREHYHLDL